MYTTPFHLSLSDHLFPPVAAKWPSCLGRVTRSRRPRRGRCYDLLALLTSDSDHLLSSLDSSPSVKEEESTWERIGMGVRFAPIEPVSHACVATQGPFLNSGGSPLLFITHPLIQLPSNPLQFFRLVDLTDSCRTHVSWTSAKSKASKWKTIEKNSGRRQVCLWNKKVFQNIQSAS